MYIIHLGILSTILAFKSEAQIISNYIVKYIIDMTETIIIYFE